MFPADKSLFLCSRDNSTVADKRGRRVSHIGQPEDQHDVSTPLLLCDVADARR
jgi:hypothetical protein